MPEQGLAQGIWIGLSAVYQRLSGNVDVSRTTMDRTIRWYEARPNEVRASAEWRFSYAWALYVANRCDSAYGVAKPLPEESPDNLAYRGLVGILAACRGDREEAMETSRWFEALHRPYLRGDNTWWQALIAGALGDGENAVALLREAFAEGRVYPYPDRYQWELIAFEPLRDYPPFQEWLRPKG